MYFSVWLEAGDTVLARGEGGRYQDHKRPDRTLLNSDDIVTSWHEPTQFQQILFTSEISGHKVEMEFCPPG